jgi:hypothetical protein
LMCSFSPLVWVFGSAIMNWSIQNPTRYLNKVKKNLETSSTSPIWL